MTFFITFHSNMDICTAEFGGRFENNEQTTWLFRDKYA